eukprot:CAMPEP_0206494418 /NCGR_PEP_ID=MMETSP0324_2-20121206/47709_1 /ASSEMBLY_ACC=CAM_ASM_000836 /TAXON_ID=2866 /ORGANISM="Crypthecodinium cohnii, Strain Seligo" /LENGTH=46 /DNA_ID= /DNA_START= /DNA_END= /DNA_ORIENTATION=
MSLTPFRDAGFDVVGGGDVLGGAGAEGGGAEEEDLPLLGEDIFPVW